MPSAMNLLSFVSSAFNDVWRAFDPLPDELPEKNAHSIPQNLGGGNAPLDDLWYYFARETIRALARSLFGVELESPGVSPYGIGLGHGHDQDQDAAMSWWAGGQTLLWFEEGAVTEGGAGVIDQTTETDLAWWPISVPNGCSLAYCKLRVGTQAADDVGFVRCRLYAITGMNSALAAAETAFLKIESPDGGLSPRPDGWIELSPIRTDGFSVSNNIRQGWVRVSGFVAVAGDKAWVSEIVYGLREGL